MSICKRRDQICGSQISSAAEMMNLRSDNLTNEQAASNKGLVLHVLLVEDNPADARLVEMVLQQLTTTRFQVHWVDRLQSAFDKLADTNFDVVLLDLNLPDAWGLETFTQMHQRAPNIAVIVMSGLGDETVALKALQGGAQDYLVKGEITPRSLERSLRYALRLGETLAELRRLATTDPLTGLLNRREFDRLLAEESARARRSGHPLGLVLVDVDHFKRINDSRGHAAGDAVLRGLAERITRAARSVDRIARIGGDELAVLLPQTDPAGALATARGICAEARSAGDTVSAGAAALAGATCESEVLLAAADRALYAAKGQGRDRAVVAPTQEARP